MGDKKRLIMTGKDMALTLRRMANEILEKNKITRDLTVVGIRTRGVYLAQYLVNLLYQITKKKIPLGILDIVLYRDDFSLVAKQPIVKPTNIPFDIDDKKIILVDDVLYTGRTVRAAIDELIDFGRPKAIQLAVLIDRSGRELPIQPDYVGRTFPVERKEIIEVRVKPMDGKDEVLLCEAEIPAGSKHELRGHKKYE